MKVTYYELLTKMLNGEPAKKVKYFNCIYTFDGKNYINSAGKYIMPFDIDAISVKNIEIIEEPKEELKELEEIEFAKAGDETIIIINKLIENQNKIIRELKDNKGNE